MDMYQKKVLITGASGYIGGTVIQFLIKGGLCPVALLQKREEWSHPAAIEIRYADAENTASLSDAMRGISIVLHLAGFKGYSQCSKEIGNAVEANIAFTNRIIGAALKERSKIISASTYWVYGHKADLPYREDSVIMPSEPYGWSKAIAEQLIISSGLPYAVVRLANVFGYGMGKGYDEVAALFLSQALKGKEVVLANEGKNQIDLVYIDDVCRTITDIIKLGRNDLILNVGSGKPITIYELVSRVNAISKQISGKVAKGIKRKDKPDEIVFADRWVDISKLVKLTGFKPTALNTALERLADDLGKKEEYAKKDKNSAAAIS